MQGFRNYLNHKYSIKGRFALREYEKYIKELAKTGADEIEHAGRRLTIQQKERAKDIVSIIHENGMKAVLYKGIFGTEDITHRRFEDYAQRDKQGKILSYGKGPKSAMMCPASPYVKEILAPEINEALEAGYDKIFIDMPWIMKRGCHCNNCLLLRKRKAGNDGIVREGLDKLIEGLNKTKETIAIGINSSAPGIYRAENGGSIENLYGFDEYITEWNPYRWGMSADSVGKCVRTAKARQKGRFYHATTCTDRKGRLLGEDRLTKLFSQIIKEGATPRLGIGFRAETLKTIGEAWKKAKDSQSCSANYLIE